MNTDDTRRVLVTGGCGYLGSHLIRDLGNDPRFAPATIHVLDNLQRGQTQALFDLPRSARYRFFEGDILDPATLRRALAGVDAVIHLAAIVHTPMSVENAAWVQQVNHWGTSHLVDACADAGVERIVFASSAAVYGPGGPFREDDVCRPLGHYAQSKRRAEEVLLAARERGIRPQILRLGSFFGLAPVMRLDAVVNHLGYLAGIRRALPVHGTGEQRRPAIHVADASDALRFALAREAGEDGELFNAVSGSPSVNEVVAAIHEALPSARAHYTEQDVLDHLSMDVDGTALREAGWQPTHSLAAGLGELLERFAALRPVDRLPVDEL
jgi:UDP-glucose 4-epimerase